MGARSSQSRGPGLNETDGHLLEYFRNTFGAGGGGNSGPTTATGLWSTSIDTSTMLTHVIFHPVQKSKNRVIEVIYTIRIQLS